MNNNLLWAQQHIALHNADYKRYRRYYEGEHVFYSAVDEKYSQHPMVALLKEIKGNLCKRVVNVKLSRLKFAGWQSDKPEVSKLLDDYYTKFDIKSEGSTVTIYGLIYGDGLGLVWPGDDGMPELWPENPCETCVLYDEYQKIKMAVKVWNMPVGTQQPIGNVVVTRVNVYDAVSVRRYTSPIGLASSEALMTPYEDDGFPWEQPNPFGEVPVVHWCSGIEPWDFGRSDLADVINIQDKLNSAAQDSFLITRQQSYPQRYVIGMDAVIDPQTGQPVSGFKPGPDQVWELAEDVTAGQFPAADTMQVINMMEDARGEICRVSSTPSHLLTVGATNFPSGEALKTAEAPLLDAVELIQTRWSKAWVQVGKLVCKCLGVDPGHLTAKWADTTPHSDKEQAETAVLKKGFGVSDEQLQEEAGYDQPTRERMAKENAENQARSAATAVTAFNRGV